MTREAPDDEASDAAGSADRRSVLLGLGTLGAAGVAGCLGDSPSDVANEGSPTATTTPMDGSATISPTAATTDGTSRTPTDAGTATDTETPTPVDPETEPVPAALTSKFYLGAKSLAVIDDRDPTNSRDVDLITTEPADATGAFRFVGVLPIDGRLLAGTYDFVTDPDLVASGRLRVFIEGEELLFSEGRERVQLHRGRHDFRVEFLREEPGETVSLGWRGTYGGLPPRIAEVDPVREAELPAKGQYELEVGTTPRAKRIAMPNSGSENSRRSLAVGLPSYTSFCFDPTDGSIPYAWLGAFLDYGPMVGYGTGRGDDPGRPLGAMFSVGGTDFPLRIGDPDDETGVEFQGYRKRPEPFELHYSVDGKSITRAVEGVIGDGNPPGRGLRSTVRFEEPPSEPVYFLTMQNDRLERSASVGTWDGGRLEIPGGVEEFTVTVINTNPAAMGMIGGGGMGGGGD